ncbi:MAG: phosphoribosylformylglycinamidine synthase subunit PurS [Phycisphaeraceae bacterium]|nr:phosphoribosylformylglycinamidine synthase subunit PurS [Phycisphaeraceae bacterium]MCB9847460.1 phosphoribosylformylglycinamidine synthase subunit PurS [Phycisphaeraceae bacterium]
MTTTPLEVAVHRFEVRPAPGLPDTLGESVRRSAVGLGIKPERVRTAAVYLIEGALRDADLARLAHDLLADPVTEVATIGASVADGCCTIEVLPQPGVMDPAAQTVRTAVEELTGVQGVHVATGRRYDFEGITPEQAQVIARRLLANPVVQDIHTAPFHPEAFPHGHAATQRVETVPILGLDEAALVELSKQGAFALNGEEMRAIQAHYAELGREPTLIELETLAQTWSEHCVHKTLKSTIRYRCQGDETIEWSGRPGVTVHGDGSVTIDNLLKSTVAAATFELIEDGLDWTLSVFDDNAGVIRFDDENAVCVKVETHNHPSAIEPYGGAATGVGGCVRDIMGTGLAARPIANTDVFCVAPPDMRDVPVGCLHPRRILNEVVAGVRDYGNRMGIPTVSGAVHFDARYVGNPLVYVGCIGVMPNDKVFGAPRAGDRIIALGGRTGRDGIHGATFSSEELTDTHADEFAHAVQIGNAIEEKKTLDAILRARDGFEKPLYSAITDCGAGGFSSAVGEMGEKLGASVDLSKAPLKYAGLTATEIWISEAQERMVLSVPPENVAKLQRICDEEHVELADLGEFGTEGAELILNFGDLEVGRLPMGFLHDGLPRPTREAVWTAPSKPTPKQSADVDFEATLLRLLSNPKIASKRWIVRQYDHEVQGNTIIKPLVGPGGIGPGDATVILPVPGSKQGLAIACGMATSVGDPKQGGDPYEMAKHAIDECVRNLVCVGADPDRIAILDNFCWPSCGKPGNLASLVRAAAGCYDAARAYRTPFISGKDSLNNQFMTETGETIEIPPTLLISGVGIVPDVGRCVTMDAKPPQGETSSLIIIGDEPSFGERNPKIDLQRARAAAIAVSLMIERGYAVAVHDVSEGGPLVAVAEMLIAAGGELGAAVDFPMIVPCFDPGKHTELQYDRHQLLMDQPGRYLLQIAPGIDDWCRDDRVWECIGEASHIVGLNCHRDEDDLWDGEGIFSTYIGCIDRSGVLWTCDIEIPVARLTEAFHAPLDW